MGAAGSDPVGRIVQATNHFAAAVLALILGETHLGLLAHQQPGDEHDLAPIARQPLAERIQLVTKDRDPFRVATRRFTE